MRRGFPRRRHRPIAARDIHVLAMVAALAVAALGGALIYNLGVLIMRRLPLLAVLAVTVLALAGCGTLTGAEKGKALQMGLEHIEGCDRTYTGGTGVGAAFTFNIVCRAREAPPTVAPAAPISPAAAVAAVAPPI